ELHRAEGAGGTHPCPRRQARARLSRRRFRSILPAPLRQPVGMRRHSSLSIQTIDGKALKQMILRAAARLEAEKDAVNALNVFPVPDGDTGTNMSMTLTSANREVERAGDRTVGEVAAALAQGS